MPNTTSQSRPFRVMIIIVLLFALFLAISNRTGFMFEEIHYEFSYSSQFPKGITLSGVSLTVHGVPDNPDYRYMMLILKDSDGTVVYRKTASGNKKGEARFLIRYLSGGSYTISLYHSFKQNTPFLSDIDEGLTLAKEEDRWVFSDSPALAMNQKAAEGERNDERALSFYLLPEDGIQSTDSTITSLAEALTREQNDPYSRVLAVHDWVCSNITYDYDQLAQKADHYEYSATSVLKSRSNVCEGFANLTVALLRAAGIPSKKIIGYAVGADGNQGWPQGVYDGSEFQSNHAWVEAFVNGRWIIMDPTWDSFNVFKNVEAESGEVIRHRYFDVTQELFALDHAVTDSNNFSSLFLYINYPEYQSNSEWKEFDENGTVPIVQNDSIMVPLRTIMEEMNGTLQLEQEKYSNYTKATCNVNNHNIQMWLDYETFYVDGRECRFETPPQEINGSIMVPVRSLFEAIGCRVEWDGKEGNQPARVTIDYVL